MLTTAIVLSVVALVQSHDVQVGNSTEGRKIFDEVRHASPAIWRQTETFTINTTDAEVISRVAITDLRPDKDGDVKILEGGAGQKNVTIELKSPTVLRGYDFKIEIYAVPDNQETVNREDIPTDPEQVRKQRNPEEIPKNSQRNLDLPQTVFENAQKASTDENIPSISNDTQVNEDETKTADNNAEKINNDKLTLNTGADADKDIKTTAQNHEVQDSTNNEHSRHGRDATSEAAQKVSEQTTSKYSTVRLLHETGSVIHPGSDYSNYTSEELFPNNASSNAQEENRKVRDVNKNEEETQPPALIGEQSKTVEDTKQISTSTTAKSVTDSAQQQPRVNVPFQRPYPIQRATSVGTTTDKSQDKRETELINTETSPKSAKLQAPICFVCY